jgi:hypothetical protein
MAAEHPQTHGALRDAPEITVRLIWRRHDPHPYTHAAIALLADLYRQRR